jgi:hypothetical protein
MHPYAVWTGDEVIVWGGHNPDAPTGQRLHGDGYRFNPRRSEVRTLTLRLAPSPRFAADGQAAVWTGREMVIWGGRGDDGALTDGAAYTPSLDRWTQFANAMAPLAHVTAVLTSTGVVLSGTSVPGDTWRWEPSLGNWVRLSSGVAPASARRGQSAVWTGSELLVWGGTGDDGHALADGWRSSPQRRRSLAMRSEGAPEARSMHSATWSTSEMLVFGGRDTRGAALGTLASYIPASNTWREVSSQGAPSPRWGHVAVWTGHALMVWGGTQGATVFADGGSYDPWDDAWRPIAAPRDVGAGHARYGAAAVWTGEELVVMGGSDGTPSAGPLGWRYQP